MIRKVLLAAMSALVLVLLAGSDVAHADQDIVFGIRPTKAQADNPESFSYFSHSLAPGAVLEEQALVMIQGEGPITLKVYVSDGITAVNGGTTFTKPGIENHGVDRWISLQDSEITLRTGEDKVVPFTIRVPSDAVPGEHVAGIVAEAGASPMSGNEGSPSGSESAAFGVQVVRRVGVAVLVDVPGARVPGLDIARVGMSGQNDSGAVFLLSVLNTGNISLKAKGTLAVKDSDGVELATVPTELDTVLAGDDTFYYVRHPLHLEDGDYLLCATLDYYAVRGEETGNATCAGDFELTIKDGQPISEGGPLPPAEPPDIATIGGGGDGGDGGIGTYGAVGLAAALALAAGIQFHRRRRRNDVTGPDVEPPPDAPDSPETQPSPDVEAFPDVTAPPEAQPSPRAEASPTRETSPSSVELILTSLERVTTTLDVLTRKISRDLPATPDAQGPPDAPPSPHTVASPGTWVSFEPVPSPDWEASSDEQSPSIGASAPGVVASPPRRQSVTVLPGVPASCGGELEITDIGMREQNENGAVFVFGVRNTDRNSPRYEGTLAIKDPAGNEIASIPIALGTVMPGGDTVFYINHAVRLQDGAYLLSASLQYHEAGAQRSGTVTCAQDFELTIRDGQPEVST